VLAITVRSSTPEDQERHRASLPCSGHRVALPHERQQSHGWPRGTSRNGVPTAGGGRDILPDPVGTLSHDIGTADGVSCDLSSASKSRAQTKNEEHRDRICHRRATFSAGPGSPAAGSAPSGGDVPAAGLLHQRGRRESAGAHPARHHAFRSRSLRLTGSDLGSGAAGVCRGGGHGRAGGRSRTGVALSALARSGWPSSTWPCSSWACWGCCSCSGGW
jgi:hypothetical protein